MQPFMPDVNIYGIASPGGSSVVDCTLAAETIGVAGRGGTVLNGVLVGDIAALAACYRFF